MRRTSVQYSKSAEGSRKAGAFASDIESKEKSATPAAREAAEFFLAPRYKELLDLTATDQASCPGRIVNR